MSALDKAILYAAGHTRVGLTGSITMMLGVSSFLRFVPRPRLELLSGDMVIGIRYGVRS